MSDKQDFTKGVSSGGTPPVSQGPPGPNSKTGGTTPAPNKVATSEGKV